MTVTDDEITAFGPEHLNNLPITKMKNHIKTIRDVIKNEFESENVAISEAMDKALEELDADLVFCQYESSEKLDGLMEKLELAVASGDVGIDTANDDDDDDDEDDEEELLALDDEEDEDDEEGVADFHIDTESPEFKAAQEENNDIKSS